jgi:ABC-2 type transport system ATP-binding protein
VVALDGLTFSVPPGEVFGFLGPNGAGKTTAMRAIFGVVALEAGQVRWHGQPAAGPVTGLRGEHDRVAAGRRGRGADPGHPRAHR